jgi:tetratricopeptide (TPR) repeat protein
MKLIKKVGENEWLFLESERVRHVTLHDLTEAEELMEAGKASIALKALQRIAENVPDCIEVYNDLYICRCILGKSELAFEHIQTDVASIRAVLPEEFFGKKQILSWDCLENRPFMRLYHSLGIALLESDRVEAAKSIFENLVGWNPNDNQGVRENLVDCYLACNDFKSIVSLAKRYPRDIMAPCLTYFLPLGLFKLGKVEEAKKALRVAVKCLPSIGKELLKQKHKQPQGVEEGFIQVGGEDQAYFYWQEYGHLWKSDEILPLLEMLAQLVNECEQVN